ncbi:hypothetical protein FTUN_6229 [Frigoriglobus tundricola]|uniref:Uncharacterized protein n=1 Tax=Frigoriglobus tundricola TaxID=2774151 RepID=A0A6M5YYM1_9BACT|nr:hypothetical protein FTUN_6229 [Frigoriglobus tundricola]
MRVRDHRSLGPAATEFIRSATEGAPMAEAVLYLPELGYYYLGKEVAQGVT